MTFPNAKPNPKGIKIPIPAPYTEELGRFYELVFLNQYGFNASWVAHGHRAYGEGEAINQDGYVYLWPVLRGLFSDWQVYFMSADPEFAKDRAIEYVEINPMYFLETK